LGDFEVICQVVGGSSQQLRGKASTKKSTELGNYGNKANAEKSEMLKPAGKKLKNRSQ
jgi:hypothetical protein